VFIWLAAGAQLPGGRWFAIHLFTLGVLSNLILAFSHHFALTVTRGNQTVSPLWPVITNGGILLVLIGLPQRQRPVMVAGATLVTASVFAAYLRLRSLRTRALGARFTWIVRLYERAHVAFIHGAVLGALVGTNAVTGAWWGSVRLAHLHANVLGWGGLTLLATLVFFGPTMTHTKILPDADRMSARVLRHGATALTVAIGLLILTGADGGVGIAARVAAAGSLAVFATSVTRVCIPVHQAARKARHSAQRPLMLALTVWLPVTVWADVVVIATGAWRFLDALGAAAFLGVLSQAVLATLMYVAPLLRGRSTHARELIRSRLLVHARTRAVAVNLAAIAVTVGATAIQDVIAVTTVGFVLLALTVLVTLVTVLRPVNLRQPRAA